MNFIKKYKSELLLGGGAVLAGLLSFVITLNVYPIINSNTNADNGEQVAVGGGDNITSPNIEPKENLINEIVSNENNSGMHFIETENSIINISDTTVDTAKNNIQDTVIQTVTNVSNASSDLALDKKVEDEVETIETISRNLKQSFVMPISGDIILEFAKDKLVYSETLEEWITHDGVDIMGKVAEPVKAAADGIVESIKMDPRYGNTIIIDHGNNIKTVYSNLSTLEIVHVGKEVNAGDIISGVGEGFGFESREGAHIHFEILKDGVLVNPIDEIL